MSKKKLVEDIKLNPQRFYRVPSDVVRDRRFSGTERLEILAAWESLESIGAVELQQVTDAVREVERKLAMDDVAQKQ